MNVVGVYKGNTPIIKVYKGQSLVWQVNSGGGGEPIEPVPSYHLTCTYYVTDTTAPTKILNNVTSFADTMYVDDEPMPKASGVTFSTTGTHTIGYNLSGDTLSANAFPNITALTEVVFGDVNVTFSKPTGLWAYGQFYKCTHLESVDMSRATITSLDATSSMYSAFYGCTSLTDVKLSNSLTTMSGPVFINCTALASITIPSSVTALTDYTSSIGGSSTYGVFQGCTSLKEVIFEGSTAPAIAVHTFPNGNAGTFYYPCGSDYSAVASQLSMWTDGCGGSGNISTWSLRGVIDGSTTSVVAGLYNTNESDYIDKMMVDGVEVDKNTVTLQQYKDGKMHNVDFYFTEDFIPEDFLDIAQLAYVAVEVGEGITEIRDRAFQYMEITSATLPSTLTYISYDAFFRDYNLASLTFNGNVPPMLYDEDVFTSVPDYCVLYVPDGSESAYESWKPNPNWTIDGYAGGAPPVGGDDM